MTDMTAAQYQAMIAKEAAPDKGRVRGTKRVKCQGQTFDSKRERDRWLVLRDMEKRGEISDLCRQVPIDLLGRHGPILTPTGSVMRYKADFAYYDHAAGYTVIEDAKGHPTDVFLMKRAILAAQGIDVVTV